MYLIDTSILVRLANVADPLQIIAVRALSVLNGLGESLHVTPQNLIEFRNVATRPKAVNGLGMTIAEADMHAADFETTFLLLEETPTIFPAWKSVVDAAAVVGKQVHDARLVAICHVYSVTHLLTFNIADFRRFAPLTPGLTVVDPATV